MSIQVDDEDLRVVRGFLSAERASFASHCGGEEEAQRIYGLIGGETE